LVYSDELPDDGKNDFPALNDGFFGFSEFFNTVHENGNGDYVDIGNYADITEMVEIADTGIHLRLILF